MRKRLLYLNGDAGTSPWSEMATFPPEGVLAEGWPLAQAHEWQPSSNADPVLIVLVDIDVIANTVPLDEWALKAWKSTLNDIIAKATNPDGRAPLPLAYTREPSWDRAVVALRVGARDVVKLSRLNDKIRELLAPANAPEPMESDERAENVISLPFSANRIPGLPPVEAEIPAIPKHAIPFPIDGLEGSSSAIEAVRNLIRKTAPLESSILIAGPTGSGKERVARAIHRYSPRGAGPFIAVNCGAIAPGLMETELFGHVKGAYTGAHDDRTGLIIAAAGGTLFLDEVSELPPEFQVKLLRVLQERQVTPVGSSKSVAADIRLLSATKSDLDERVTQGKFREDLLYRLRVMEIVLPSLRERKADIPGLSKTILRKFAKRSRQVVLNLTEAVVEKFLLHGWPGNIRELENTLEHAATLAWADRRSEILVKDLPEAVQFATMSTSKEQQLKEVVRNFEREYIQSTVRRLGSKEQAADILGLSLATLYRKIGS